jgi:DNA-3-methyladenine glycosylase
MPAGWAPAGSEPGEPSGGTPPRDTWPPLARARLAAPALAAARDLLGTYLVRRDDDGTVRVGRIVEVEAYIGPEDRACHARFGRTERNAVMFGPPGHAYVYLVYGMYDCLNVVVEPDGYPAAILVRAVEPILGIERMRAARMTLVASRRRLDPASLERAQRRLLVLPAVRLASGPGAVCAAFSIDRSHNGVDLCTPASPLWLADPGDDPPTEEVVATPRVGIDYAGEPWVSRPWRFFLAGSPSVSGGGRRVGPSAPDGGPTTAGEG